MLSKLQNSQCKTKTKKNKPDSPADSQRETTGHILSSALAIPKLTETHEPPLPSPAKIRAPAHLFLAQPLKLGSGEVW